MTEYAAEAGGDLTGRALTALGGVLDPELGVDIVSLGLVYDVRVTGRLVEVEMTLTTPGCPVAEQLPAQAAAVLTATLPHHQVEVRVVWQPPWTPELLSPAALQRLGYRTG